jgi:hypothetical protein
MRLDIVSVRTAGYHFEPNSVRDRAQRAVLYLVENAPILVIQLLGLMTSRGFNLNEELKFKCQVCGDSFKDEDDLKDHAQGVHGLATDTTVKPK